MSFQPGIPRSACVARDPLGSLRSSSPAAEETITSRPSGSQAVHSGSESTRAITSLRPARSTQTTSPADQSEKYSRSPCQRGDSTRPRPVSRVRTPFIVTLPSAARRRVRRSRAAASLQHLHEPWPARSTGDTCHVEPQVVRYSERPELWDAIENLSDEVWPEYNQHGDTLNHYWGQLYDTFPEWQFVLYDPDEKLVLAEGHTIPLAWDGTDDGLGPGIDATIAGAFALRQAGGRATAASALAAEIPPRHQGRRLSGVLLQAMSALAH